VAQLTDSDLTILLTRTPATAQKSNNGSNYFIATDSDLTVYFTRRPTGAKCQIYFVPPPTEDGDQPPTENISYCTTSITTALTPGLYDIPPDQQDNLQWFVDNDFRLDRYGRLHVGYMMTDNNPDQVQVI